MGGETAVSKVDPLLTEIEPSYSCGFQCGKVVTWKKLVRIQYLCSTAFALMFVSGPAFGCKCVSPPPDVKTARDLVQWHAKGSDAIFEGMVQRVELKWQLTESPVGGLVSTDFEQDPPVLQVTFDVSRPYKGVERKDLVLTTGIGGGDCGYDFEIGVQYLVFAYRDDSGHLSTGICSGTELLEESQSDLSYLRGEPADSGSIEKAASVSPTTLCGHVVGTGLELADSQVFLFRVGSKSPIPSEEAEVTQDGSFCFEGARPGNYYLAFISRTQDSPTSFVLFPGTGKLSESTTLDLRSGLAIPSLVFNVPPQPTFSVRGRVIVPKQSPLPTESKVFLLSVEPLSSLVAYSEDVNPDGSFGFPRVLPGKYCTVVGVDSDAAANWATRKAEVEVNATVSGLSLELVQK